MAPRWWLMRAVVTALPLMAAGCFDEPPVPDSGLPVFSDAFADGFAPNPFDTSVLTSLQIDTETAHSGTASIRFDVPGSGVGYTGGAVLAGAPKDLRSANALVFWAKASRPASWDHVGYGLNFGTPSTYQACVSGLPLTTEWTRHAVPIPDASKLAAEKGVLWYVEVDPTGYQAWFDDVKFDRLDPAALAVTPTLASDTATLLVGGTEVVVPTIRYTDLDGAERTLDSTASAGSGPAPAWFTFSSSRPSVARVDPDGVITGVSVGQSNITVRLNGVPVPGTVVADVVAAVPTQPATAAPTPPARAAGDVVSLYTSDQAYAPVPVDTWQTSWSSAGAAAVFTVPGTTRVVKKYTALQFAGVEFLSPGPHVDARGMTTLHVDLWTPDATGFAVKLVGWNGTSTATGEAQVGFGPTTIKKYRWVSLEIPLSAYAGVDLANIGQLVWINTTSSPSTNGTFFIDNVYFHK